MMSAGGYAPLTNASDRTPAEACERVGATRASPGDSQDIVTSDPS